MIWSAEFYPVSDSGEDYEKPITNSKGARLIGIIAFGFLASTAYYSTYTEDFEDIGGFSGITRIPGLDKSGNRAWMARGDEAGMIQFDPGFLNVSFYAKAFSGADASTTIIAFDINNDSLILNSGDPFSRFMVSGQLGRIEIANHDSDNARFNAVDDVQVNNVPLPTAIWLFASALLGFVRC